MAASYYDVQREPTLKALRSGSERQKLQALAQLAEVGASGALALGLTAEVATLLTDPSDEVQLSAMEALGAMEEVGAQFADAVVAHLKSKDNIKRTYAVGALGMMGVHAAKYCGDIVECLRDSDAGVRAASCLALSTMGGGRFVADVAKCIDDKVADVAVGAISALTDMEPGEAQKHCDAVASKLGDANKEVRNTALLFFAKFSALAPRHGDSITKLLMDDDCSVRQAVINVFEELQEKQESMVALAAKTLSHQDARFRAAAASAIGATGPFAKKQVSALTALLDDTSEDKSQLIYSIAGIENKAPCTVRIPACAALGALSKVGDSTCCKKVAELLASKNAHIDVRIMAVGTLGELGSGGDYETALAQLLSSPQPQLRVAAAQSIGKLAKKKTPSADLANQVAELLVDKSPLVRAAAAECLGCMSDEGAAFTGALVDLFSDSSASVRISAVKALAGVGVKGQLYAGDICRRMKDDAPQVKVACVEALASMERRGAAFADEVAALSTDQEHSVRVAVLHALSNMSGADARQFFLQAVSQAQGDTLQQVRDAAESLLASKS